VGGFSANGDVMFTNGNAADRLFAKQNERHVESMVQALTPAQSGSTEKEDDTMSDKLIKALGARDEEHALQIVAASTAAVQDGKQAQATVTKLEELTGAQGDALLGAVSAWKSDHESLPELTKERDELKAKVEARDKAEAAAKKQAVLDQIFDEGKATKAELELMKDNSVEYLESWLKNASKRIPGAGEKQDDAEPKITSLGELTAEDRKQIEQLGCSVDDYVAAKKDLGGKSDADDELEADAPTAG
jgi:Mu-like prophage I protein